jgi:hypothetical protein
MARWHVRARAYAANRRAAIEGIIDADPVAACAREIMASAAHGRAVSATFCGPTPPAAATSF